MPTTGNIPLQDQVGGNLISAALWNNEFQNIANLMDPIGVGGYSATDTQMQIQTNPDPGGVTSHASSLGGELERLRYMIAQITGNTYWYQSPSSSISGISNDIVPVGGVIDYPTNTAPNTNWHLADGTAISRSLYPTLFSLIGTTFGTGDGSTTFNLPDYRDRMSIGAGNSYAVAATGGAASTSPSITITDPGHNHTQNSHTHTDSGHTHSTPNHTHTLANGAASSAGSITGNVTVSGGNLANTNSSGGSNTAVTPTTSSGGGGTTGSGLANIQSATATNNSSSTGISASTTVNTLNPYLAMYKMIRII